MTVRYSLPPQLLRGGEYTGQACEGEVIPLLQPELLKKGMISKVVFERGAESPIGNEHTEIMRVAAFLKIPNHGRGMGMCTTEDCEMSQVNHGCLKFLRAYIFSFFSCQTGSKVIGM